MSFGDYTFKNISTFSSVIELRGIWDGNYGYRNKDYIVISIMVIDAIEFGNMEMNALCLSINSIYQYSY